MLIRRMTVSDAAKVAAIEAENFSQPWSENAFIKALESPDNILVVAQDETDEEIVGYICMYVALDEGEITNVAVAGRCRQKGIGRQLMSAVFEEAAVHGVNRIVLEVRISNMAAIGLYKKMGFVELGIRKGFYDLPKEDACIMEYTI